MGMKNLEAPTLTERVRRGDLLLAKIIVSPVKYLLM